MRMIRRFFQHLSFVRLLQYALFLGILLLLINTLWWRYQLAVHRYYDVDEFAHLRWASMVVRGYRPYIDFLTFFPPGFFWFLSPLFFFGSGVTPIDSGRFMMFLLLVLVSLSTGLIFWKVRRSFLWILASLIVAYLPIPSDKFIEIRPDSLATFFWLAGIFTQILWMRSGKKSWGFMTGVLYTASCVVLTKMAPIVTFAGMIALFRFIRKLRLFVPILLGSTVVALPVLLWIVLLGDFARVWYSLTLLPLEANKISQVYGMRADLFFYPNDIFYGCWGWCSGLVINHFFWLLGLGVGVFRLFTPFMPGGKSRAWEELLLAGSFVLQMLLFVHFIPLKHTQYLIPVVVFVGFYVADGILYAWNTISSTFLYVGVFLMLGLSFFGMYRGNSVINEPKLHWTNSEMRESILALQNRIPKDAYVLDFDGRTLYYKNPYYVCCLPWGQFATYVSYPLPSLIQSLDTTQTGYIFVGQLGREQYLTAAEKQYISQNYQEDSQVPGLLVRNNLTL